MINYEIDTYINSSNHIIMADHFVYCEYERNFLPRAVIIPLNNIDKEMLEQYNKIIKLGSKIEDCYDWDETAGYHVGYKINGKLDNTEETKKIIEYWSSLLHTVDHDREGRYHEDFMFYYINDCNRTCSPSELYDTLLALKEFRGKKINVKSCAMVSEISFGEIKRLSLRFFLLSKDIFTPKQVEEMLLKDSRFYSVKCASNNGKFVGYGFVELSDGNHLVKLMEKTTVINNNKFYFD